MDIKLINGHWSGLMFTYVLTPKVLELINLSLWMTPEEILVTIGHSVMIDCYPISIFFKSDSRNLIS